jgi:hypothetical protein
VPDTKICDECDVECGISETKCPKCGADFAEQDELVEAIERAQRIKAKRDSRNAPPPPPQPVAKPTLTHRLRGLGKVVKRA